MPARKPAVYGAVPMTNRNGSVTWGIKGAWKTVNSTMGFYPTEDAANKAIERMTRTPTTVIVRRIPGTR